MMMVGSQVVLLCWIHPYYIKCALHTLHIEATIQACANFIMLIAIYMFIVVFLPMVHVGGCAKTLFALKFISQILLVEAWKTINLGV